MSLSNAFNGLNLDRDNHISPIPEIAPSVNNKNLNTISISRPFLKTSYLEKRQSSNDNESA